MDVDGDGKLNNMDMRSFYAVQLHRMQCMGHEIVPFEDMLCQMMDMIKPKNSEHLIVEDFLQPECCQVSGALFDALFNLNKYLMFEQRDPCVERQKREDEFECDWDRFACIDYKRLAMEEEAREEAREREANAPALTLLRPLTDKEQHIVREAMEGVGPEDEDIAQVGNDMCQRGSMQTLLPTGWLNDEVIHYFYIMLRKRDEEICSQDGNGRKRNHFDKSFFMTKLLNKGHSRRVHEC